LLDLSGTRISNEGVQRLQAVKGLRKLWLSRTKISAEAQQAFSIANPDCELVVSDPSSVKGGCSLLRGGEPHAAIGCHCVDSNKGRPMVTRHFGCVEGSPVMQPIETSDFDDLSNLIAVAVRERVASNEEDASFLIKDIVRSFQTWQAAGSAGFHAKYSLDGAVFGFIVVKHFWNLSHLFVLPCQQRHGIGRCLMQAAIESCRNKSPRGKIQLNSSAYAAPFYAAMGFKQVGPGIERPGGCIPFELSLQ
jgi:GNAT superfamily N-acetyltransferase